MGKGVQKRLETGEPSRIAAHRHHKHSERSVAHAGSAASPRRNATAALAPPGIPTPKATSEDDVTAMPNVGHF